MPFDARIRTQNARLRPKWQPRISKPLPCARSEITASPRLSAEASSTVTRIAVRHSLSSPRQSPIVVMYARSSAVISSRAPTAFTVICGSVLPSADIACAVSPAWKTVGVYSRRRISFPFTSYTTPYIPEMFTASSQWYSAVQPRIFGPTTARRLMNASWLPLRRRFSPRFAKSVSGGRRTMRQLR